MRPTRCEISTRDFHHNFTSLQRHIPQGAHVLAVVKANAYGHGAVGMVRLLLQEGVSRFAVATVREALALRSAGVTATIVLLGGPYGEYALCAEHRLTPVFSDMASLAEWSDFLRASGASVPCHVKLDTGMGRLGFTAVEPVIAFLASSPQLKVEGVLTHLAVADEEDESSRAYTEQQLQRFITAATRLQSAHPALRYLHCANSALTLRHDVPKGCHLLVRPGLSLYGVFPQAWIGKDLSPALVPVLSWKTAIHSVKSVDAGEPISYGRTFVTSRPSRIAVIPVGYADGYSRRLSNRAYVLVRGQRAPVIGRVCMDLTMIDVTDIADAVRGDEVVLLGNQGSELLPVETLAQWAETIPYEIFCAISERVERVHV